MRRLVLVILLLSIPVAYAKSSDLFIDHLSGIIYKDCQSQDIHIKDNFIFNTITNKTVTLIQWPYDYSALRRIIQLFGEGEPYDFYNQGAGISIGGSRDGKGILKCGDYSLDINQYTYLWRGTRVDVPKEEFKTTFGNNSPIVETHGENSPVTIGRNSPITQILTNQYFTISISFALTISVFFNIYLWKKLKISKEKKPD